MTSAETGLRDYQREGIQGLFNGWDGVGMDPVGRQVVHLPTGTGKTVIIAHLVVKWFMERMRTSPLEDPESILILVDRDELVDQTLDKLTDAFTEVDPHNLWDVKFGVVKAERNVMDADVIVGSIQTLSRQNRLDQLWRAGRISLVIVDECHIRPEQYSRIMEHVGCFRDENPTPAAGFTATLMRAGPKGKGQLERIWQRVAFTRSILWAIGNGFLVDPVGKAVDLDIDLDGIKTSGGDFNDDDLGDAMATSAAPEAIVAAWSDEAATSTGPRRTVAFQPNVASAERLHGAFRSQGFRAGIVTGTTPKAVRSGIYQAHRAGDLEVIVNCAVLTTGWDSPETEVAIIPPTKSPVKFKQCAGRVLRPAPWSGKTDALLLLTGYVPGMDLVGMGQLSDTGVDVRDGESLKTAVEREAATPKAKRLLDELHLKEIDLFGETSVRWLRTFKGGWFVPCQDWTVFLLPEDKYSVKYSVGVLWVGKGAARRPERRFSGLTQELAFSHGEQVALELDEYVPPPDPWTGSRTFSVARKDSAWRKKRASGALIDTARAWGITHIPDGIRAGELSDQIARVKTSKWLDRLLP